jgi:hypothetical protein
LIALLQIHELFVLALHNTYWDLLRTEGFAELGSLHLVGGTSGTELGSLHLVGGTSGGEAGTPCSNVT